MKKVWLNALLVVALLLVPATPAFAQEPDEVPDSVPDHAQTDDTVPAPLPDGYTGMPDGFTAEAQVFMPLWVSDATSAYVELDDADVADASAAAADVSLDGILLPSPIEVTDVNPWSLRGDLTGSSGRVNVVVRMSNPSVAEAVGAAGEEVVVADEVQAEVQRAAISQQDQVIAAIKSKDPSARIVDRLQVVLNALIVEVDGAAIAAILDIPGVTSVNEVVDYELDLSETVPAIGGAVAHASGYTGKGVKVAVLDSGVDYTHASLGGPGTLEAYAAAYANPAARDGLFPTAKVVEGYDFVGEFWRPRLPNEPSEIPLSPDPDPIDAVGVAPLAGGHGTHVADIIAGVLGVAPDAKLMAVKVCSSVSTACNGTALLQGVEFAMDPNKDGRIWDRADVINLSLGLSYGQKQDDLTYALENAVKGGAVVVASAGNSGNKPYVTGSPSIGPSVISVAQTTQPSAAMDFLTTPSIASRIPVLAQPFAPDQTGSVTERLGATTGEPTQAQQLACEPLSGDYTGQILLISRGVCAVSLKFTAAAAAGAIIAIVYDNAAGTVPPTFGYGGGAQTIPGYTMRQADGIALLPLVGQPATIDPAGGLSLALSVVASSSRGPSYSFQSIKPDIAAPGASVSAESGTGTGTTAFSGTSGAAPVIAGAAALLLDAASGLRPYEVRALLMNNANTNIYFNQFVAPGYLAPITRIGGGEVRVNDAIAATVVAYEKSSKQGSLSFGYNALTRDLRFRTTVEVKNYTNQPRTFSISRATRYANDAWGPGGSSAVNIQAPREVRVPARGRATFDVSLYVYARQLPNWTINGGALGGNGDLLDLHEFDGYITLSERGGDSLTIPWQILPRKAADLSVRSDSVSVRAAGDVVEAASDAVEAASDAVEAAHGGSHKKDPKTVTMKNSGAANGVAQIFALTGTSPRIPKRKLPGMGDNFAVVDLQAVGFRMITIGGAPYIQFGITTYGIRSHPAYPGGFDVVVDSNNDGVDDYVVIHLENGGFAASGQTVVGVVDLATDLLTLYAYAIADLNSGNMIMTAPLSALNATPSSKMRVSIYAYDNYFTGDTTDGIENMLITPGVPKYGPLGDSTPVAPGGTFEFKPVVISGGAAATPAQNGFLILYTSQRPGFESDIIKVHKK